MIAPDGRAPRSEAMQLRASPSFVVFTPERLRP